MLDTGYLYAKNNDRIFINTCLGCNGACSYCYLPRLGYNNKSNDLLVREASQIIKDIEESEINIDEKTLITLGCFSECWDEKNRPQTIELIRYFLQKGNQIQLSTKKQVTVEDVKGFQDLIKYMDNWLSLLVLLVLVNGNRLKEIQIHLQRDLKHLKFQKN